MLSRGRGNVANANNFFHRIEAETLVRSLAPASPPPPLKMTSGRKARHI